MSDLRFTLLSDGSSDRALIPILTWLLRELTPDRAIQSEWADLRRLPEKPKTLAERIVRSVDLFECDLLFVHRDAEREPLEHRVNEIREAVTCLNDEWIAVPVICVIPVRMQEAWLLFDERAIRRASGNPNGTEALHLPKLNRLEHLPDPKEILYQLLRQASGLKGRRLARFQAHSYAPQVSAFIEDFTPLRTLPAFEFVESELRGLVIEQDWADIS